MDFGILRVFLNINNRLANKNSKSDSMNLIQILNKMEPDDDVWDSFDGGGRYEGGGRLAFPTRRTSSLHFPIIYTYV